MTTALASWTRAEPAVFKGSEVGGDHQITDGYTVRWTRPVIFGIDPISRWLDSVDRAWVAVDCTYYGVHDLAEFGPHVEVCYELTVCTDPDQPGDTELQSWARYDTVEGDYPIVDMDDHTTVYDINCSDGHLHGLAEDDEAPTADWWNDIMDDQYSDGAVFYLAADQ
jgi:hypothetical protein